MTTPSLSVDELKKLACETIEKRKKEIVGLAQQVLANPEAGFREVKTAQLVAEKFQELGISHQRGLALTGLKGRIKGGAGDGPSGAVIGELDSLVVTEHPHADPDTGAAHACGHHCQIGMMLGATMGLLTPEVTAQLSGEIVPFAVPAEEFIEVEQTLWNSTVGYAGTADAIAKVQGEVVVLDLKTGASGIYPEAALQLSAYANAEFVMEPNGTRRPRPPIEAAAAGHLRPEKCQVIPIRLGTDVFETFVALRRVFLWETDIKQGVVGRPVDPDKESE